MYVTYLNTIIHAGVNMIIYQGVHSQTCSIEDHVFTRSVGAAWSSSIIMRSSYRSSTMRYDFRFGKSHYRNVNITSSCLYVRRLEFKISRFTAFVPEKFDGRIFRY